jgi:hypothetical protein
MTYDMTANEIFKELLKDPIFSEKYNFSEKQLEKMGIHEPSKPIVELLKLIIQGKENNIPDSSIYIQIKKIQKI